jgi:hypothetical protein
MRKLITALLLATLSIVASAYANGTIENGIDVQEAYGGAFTIVSIKFLLAAVVFYTLSFGLWGKAKNTAVENGRWIGSLLAAISIISSTTLHKSNIDLYVSGAILTVVWFLIGFVIGFVWKKFKTGAKFINYKFNSDNYAFIVLAGFCIIMIVIAYFNDKPTASVSIPKTSEINLTSIKPKLGSDWNWHQISGKWWIVDDSYEKNKYGFVDVWLKIEIMEVAKKEGENYSHTIVNAVFSCNDKNFKFNSITHVFDNEYIDDKADLEDLAAYINFSKLDDNSKGLANTYHYVCDR